MQGHHPSSAASSYSRQLDESLITPPNNIIYHSATYETTPLLSFTGGKEEQNVEPAVDVSVSVNSASRYTTASGRYTEAITGNYNTSGKYVQVPKYPSNRSYPKPVNIKLATNVVLLTVMLQSVGFTLVLPSMNLYLADLGGKDSFLGWVVAIYSVGSFIGSILFGWWCDKRNAKEAILVASIVSIGGNVLYCLINFLPEHYGEWFMLLARFFVGFGSGCVAVCRAFCSEVADAKSKVRIMAAVSAAQGIGFVIGPGLGSGLSAVNFKIGRVVVNHYTSPGYLSAFFCLICFIFVFFSFPVISTKRDKSNNFVTQSDPLAPVIVALFVFFSAVSVFAIFETDFTILSKNDFNWGSFNNSIYFLIAAVISTIMYFIIGTPFAKKFDERKATAVGIVILILGMLAFIVYDKPVHIEDHLNLTQIIIGGVLFSVAYPIASTYIFALYSKILNPVQQGSKMGWITAAGSLARMLGPIWASNALSISDTVVFGGTALFLCITLVVLFASYRILVPHRDFGKNLPQ